MDRTSRAATLSYLITVSQAHVVPAAFLLASLLQKTDADVFVVGNLTHEQRMRLPSSAQVTYIDENEIDVSGRMPYVSWTKKYRELGWYKQMFLRLCVDRYIQSDHVIILDSEAFIFDNWDENRFYTENGNPKCFYWVPQQRKSEWDYAMYQGAAFVFRMLPGFETVMPYAASNNFRRHISGVVLFSPKNLAYIWKTLEKKTDLEREMYALFNEQEKLAFSDHDFYGIAMDYGLCDNVIKTEPVHELLGWYENHNDPRFERFQHDDPMWSMCQRYFNFPTAHRYFRYMESAAIGLGQKLPLSLMQHIPATAPDALALRISETEDTRRRLEKIGRVYQGLSAKLKRPLRILDLRSGTGRLSLGLAQLGADVLGLESRGEYLEQCDALRLEHPDLQLNFLSGTPEIGLTFDDISSFDMILGIDVIDELVTQYGEITLKHILASVTNNVAFCFFERNRLQMSVELSPPQDERKLFGDIKFCSEILEFAARDERVGRSLYLLSNYFWALGTSVEALVQTASASHDFVQSAYLDTRRYYLADGYIAKKFWCEERLKIANRETITHESEFLKNYPELLPLQPRLIGTGHSEREAWLVREFIVGKLLSKQLQDGDAIDAHQILLDILEQLTTLEASGLYHTDIRLWNVLITQSGQAVLIDYGAISKEANDCFDSRGGGYAFWVFAWCLLKRHPGFLPPDIAPMIPPLDFPEAYQAWAVDVCDGVNVHQTFAEMHANLAKVVRSSISCI